MDYFFQEGATQQQLVLAFHGTGGNEYQLLTTVAELFPQASLLSFLGSVSEGSQRRFFAPLIDGQLNRQEFDQQTTQFFQEELLTFIQKYQEIILIGYSNGANFILGLLEQHADIADTVILLHPSRLVYSFNQSSEVKIYLTVGAQDNISLPGDGLKLTEELKQFFPNTTMILTDGGHQLTEQEVNDIQKRLGE
ncbi:phospholipase/carboxylesterase [Enterococcus sp. DIV2402]|uniref:Phospholipase/carboxylesterase n=1 Tax=Candidatus Enterococcus lowellii TaxID=2230877 RepID=A0ABZ2SK63_9ENTE|nr:phospholipase [Enterococcus sp. DIV2402]MBO0465794.1 phospholipase [Enterococcus sp. DIV2402]